MVNFATVLSVIRERQREARGVNCHRVAEQFSKAADRAANGFVWPCEFDGYDAELLLTQATPRAPQELGFHLSSSFPIALNGPLRKVHGAYRAPDLQTSYFCRFYTSTQAHDSLNAFLHCAFPLPTPALRLHCHLSKQSDSTTPRNLG